MLREILLESLKTNLRELSLEEFAAEFITKTQAIEEFYKLCNGLNSGKTISLLFNPHRLDTKSIHNGLARSIFDGLHHEPSLNGLARLYLYNLEHGVNNAFYKSIQRGFEGIPYINEFPPFVARSIILEYTENKSVINVIDPCAGWGGRMIGCASIGNINYTACEPSSLTFTGLINLGNWLKQLQPNFDFKIFNIPYEEFVSNKKFDIALTSPPYYDTEHYSDEETNSLNRYSTFDSWVDGFYKPLILNTVNVLTDNGVLILNIGDRKYPLSERLFDICKVNGLYCERVYDYLSGNGDAKEKFYIVSKIKKNIKQKKLF